MGAIKWSRGPLACGRGGMRAARRVGCGLVLLLGDLGAACWDHAGLRVRLGYSVYFLSPRASRASERQRGNVQVPRVLVPNLFGEFVKNIVRK